MLIRDIFKTHARTFSFEFFPPKNYISTIELGINIGQLMKLSPTFVSVTYGAGGGTQDLSFDLLNFLQNKIGLTSMAHYTCVNASRDKVLSDLDILYKKNIENLMLLRGDPPKGDDKFFQNAKDFRFASDLVKIAAAQERFSIGVAGFPESHPESPTSEQDIQHLKNKVSEGADFVVTQFFFDNQYYFDYVKKAEANGMKKRIIPGIIPIVNFQQIKKFVQLSDATIPQWITDKLEPHQNDPKKTYELGVEIAIQQCTELLENGAPGIHFYTLNKSQATVEIFESLPVNLKSPVILA